MYSTEWDITQKRLAEACHLFKSHAGWEFNSMPDTGGRDDPCGLGGGIIKMIEKGFVDWIVTTGANTYHDLHFAYKLPVHQGDCNADDNDLAENDVVRIYDVYIDMQRTLIARIRSYRRLQVKPLKKTCSLKNSRPLIIIKFWAKVFLRLQSILINLLSHQLQKQSSCFSSPVSRNSSVGMGTSYLPILQNGKSGSSELDPRNS